MDLLFVMDPLELLNPATDTTLALMQKARERGHASYFTLPGSLSLEDGRPWAKVRKVTVPGPDAPFAWSGEETWREVSDFPIVWLRKDPPFDAAYVEATWILDTVDSKCCRVINDPAGVRSANEKLYALRFPDLTPPTIVTSDLQRLRDFVDRHGEVVLKPLQGSGGTGIVFAQRGMRGLNALLELVTRRGLRCEAQAYLPGAAEGDKRILLLDGEPLGAVLRLAAPGEDRNNLHLGGHAEATNLTASDRHIVERLAPSLRADGLVFVGIDVIDGRLTEVNVTSPTGIQELERLEGVDATGRVIDWCEERARSK